MTPKLKPCPFCGGKGEYIYKRVPAYMRYRDLVRPRCSDCRAQSPYGRSPQLHGWFFIEDIDKAADAWNIRGGMTKTINKRLEQLEGGVIALCETISQVKKALCGNEKATHEELLQAVSQVKDRLAQAERERDAAVQTVHGLCHHCKNGRSEKCQKCLFWPSRVYFVSTETYVDHWEWRGAKEES